MKLHKSILIEKVCSEDASRTAILEPYLDITEPGKAVLVATNGKALAVVPVEDCESDTSGYVSADVLKAGRKASGKNAPLFAALGAAAQIPGGIVMPRNGQTPADDKFPNYRQVIPADAKTRKIHLDAAQLFALSQAIGSRCVTLEFNDPEHGKGQPMMIRPLAAGKYGDKCVPVCPEAFGVLMSAVPTEEIR